MYFIGSQFVWFFIYFVVGRERGGAARHYSCIVRGAGVWGALEASCTALARELRTCKSCRYSFGQTILLSSTSGESSLSPCLHGESQLLRNPGRPTDSSVPKRMLHVPKAEYQTLLLPTLVSDGKNKQASPSCPHVARDKVVARTKHVSRTFCNSSPHRRNTTGAPRFCSLSTMRPTVSSGSCASLLHCIQHFASDSSHSNRHAPAHAHVQTQQRARPS